MKHTNEPFTNEDLFRVIGDMDDRYVMEALTYKKPKAKVLPMLTAAMSVAAAILFCIVSVAVIKRIGSVLNGNDTPPADTPSVSWSVSENYTANTSLLSCLKELSTASAQTGSIPSASGETAVVWRDEATGTYYCVSLDGATSSERSKLFSTLKNRAPATSIAWGSDEAPYSVWLITESGEILSPYLPVANGTSFTEIPGDYSPEILPSESFAALLEELLRKYGS